MFKTIKLNQDYWEKKIPNLKYGQVPNPLNVFNPDKERFANALSAFKFFGVFKTTKAGRHQQTQLFIKNKIDTLSEQPSILDIGASDGSTSLDLINLINNSFKKYYITDLNIKCTYFFHNGYTYFFNKENNCFLAATRKFVFYPVNKFLFNLFFKRTLAVTQNLPKSELLFINKDLQEKKNENERRKKSK